MRIGATVLASALLLRSADRALQAAVAYAADRHQFGRPIGSFQAIKHLLADMYVRTCLARSATYAAAAIADDRGSGDLVVAASAAKLIATDAAIRNAKTCIQVHGGMGFTWEMVPHYLLKRAWVLEHTFGSRPQHAESSIATDLAERGCLSDRQSSDREFPTMRNSRSRATTRSFASDSIDRRIATR